MKKYLTSDENAMNVAGLTPCVACLTPCVAGLMADAGLMRTRD